jgi:hypothetical protein
VPDWQAFLSSHPSWRAAVRPTEPLYCLPEPVLDVLARPRGQSPAVLAEAEARAERAFTALCRKYRAVGCWPDRPIAYDLLGPVAGPPDPGLMRQTGWTRQQRLQVQQALRRAGDAAVRLKGYAGWLLTEPTFLAEAGRLAACWRGLPAGRRPSLPLARPVPLPRPPAGAAPAPPGLTDFAGAARGLLDRWGLTQMTTWELPAPQGPLLPNPLPPGAPALPARGVHLVVPPHYPLQGDDGLLQQVLDLQRQAAREQGLDESLAGLPHYRAYAHMLEVLHLERSIRARLAGRPLPGFVTRMEEAIAAALGASLAQVRKLRKASAACLRGQRARVAWLRPRAR